LHECSNAFRSKVIKRPQRRWVQQWACFKTKLEGSRVDPIHQFSLTRQHPDPWPQGAVLVQTCNPDVNTKFEHLGLIKDRRPYPCAPRVVDKYRNPLLPRDIDSVSDGADRKYVVCDGQPRQHYECHPTLPIDNPGESLGALC